MRTLILATALVTMVGCLTVGTVVRKSRSARESRSAAQPGSKPITRALQPNSLCAKDERIIFSCPVKRPAKMVSVCASKDLTSHRGYLQYRFGLPGNIEL